MAEFVASCGQALQKVAAQLLRYLVDGKAAHENARVQVVENGPAARGTSLQVRLDETPVICRQFSVCKRREHLAGYVRWNLLNGHARLLPHKIAAA